MISTVSDTGLIATSLGSTRTDFSSLKILSSSADNSTRQQSRRRTRLFAEEMKEFGKLRPTSLDSWTLLFDACWEVRSVTSLASPSETNGDVLDES